MTEEESTNSVEVLIVGFNSQEVIGSAVQSCAGFPHLSVAVIDHGDGGSVETARATADKFGIAFRSVLDPSNPGFAAGCNTLARGSHADWLMFLNPDAAIVRFDPVTLQRSRIIGATQRDSKGALVHSSGVRWDVKAEISRSWLRRHPRSPEGEGYVGGGALLIERHVFEKLNGFDARYFLFYEDIDLCLRANKLGYPTFVDARWEVVHDVGHAARKDWSFALERSYASGRIFHAEHYGEVRRYDLYVCVDSLLRSFRSLRTSRSAVYRQLARLAARNMIQPTHGGALR
jgi:N-acetylglucosaminyl-diphospho-decaprenol L-rhamnosyltransferase